MSELNIFNELQEAWETSTMKSNRFHLALESVCAWDEQFFADGEHYFTKGGFCFTTPVLNPFEKHGWTPSAVFSDGSVILFEI